MYANTLAQLKNAQLAKKKKIKIPYSSLDMAVLEILSKYGFIEEVSKKGRMPKRVIEIKLKYSENKGVIDGFKLTSKPSQKIYSGFQNLKPVRQGYGIGVISTSGGVMTTGEARKKKIGGQLLFEIW